MAQLRIEVGHKADGFVFRLDPKSVSALRGKSYGGKKLPTVSIGFDTRTDVEKIYGEVYTHVAELLTGLTESELNKEGVVFIDSLTNKKIHSLPS
jgi:hypothetical protein